MLQQCIRWMPAVSCSSCWSVRCRQCSNRSPVAVGDVRNDGTAAEVSGAASAGQPKSAHLSRQKRANGRCVRLCSASPLANIYRRRMLAASVVNLDVHTGRGTHWVALSLDCRSGRPRIYYYDPIGRAPPRRWLKGAWATLAAAVPKSRRYNMLASALYNKSAHQRGASECGVFSMMAIDALISGKSFEDIRATRLTDDKAFMYKKRFFDPTGNPRPARSWGDLVSWARGGSGYRIRAARAHKTRASAPQPHCERRR